MALGQYQQRRLFCTDKPSKPRKIKDENSSMKYWEQENSSPVVSGDGKDYYSLYQSSYEEHLSHIDAAGKASMVDVQEKSDTKRSAKACATVIVGNHVFNLIRENEIKKGDVLTVAQVAGIMGAKKTAELIPLCHPLALSKVDVSCQLKGEDSVYIECEAKCVNKTGVEMEALTGASIAALTVYDMCKAANKAIEITGIKLLEKNGGKSGLYKAEPKSDSTK